MTSNISLSAALWIFAFTYVSSLLLLIIASYTCLTMMSVEDKYVARAAMFQIKTTA